MVPVLSGIEVCLVETVVHDAMGAIVGVSRPLSRMYIFDFAALTAVPVNSGS